MEAASDVDVIASLPHPPVVTVLLTDGRWMMMITVAALEAPLAILTAFLLLVRVVAVGRAPDATSARAERRSG